MKLKKNGLKQVFGCLKTPLRRKIPGLNPLQKAYFAQYLTKMT